MYYLFYYLRNFIIYDTLHFDTFYYENVMKANVWALNSVHLVEDVFELTFDNDTKIFSDRSKVRGNLIERFVALRKVDDHHHVEEILDDGLRDVEDVDVVIGKVCAYPCDDADSILADNGNNCSCHFIYNWTIYNLN